MLGDDRYQSTHRCPSDLQNADNSTQTPILLETKQENEHNDGHTLRRERPWHVRRLFVRLTLGFFAGTRRESLCAGAEQQVRSVTEGPGANKCKSGIGPPYDLQLTPAQLICFLSSHLLFS